MPPEVWKTRKVNDCNALYNENIVFRWTNGCILPFLKKRDLAKNYQGITFTSIAATLYNAVLFHHMEPEIEKILWKNQNGFRRNRSTTSQILTIHRRIGVRTKEPQGDSLVRRFLQGV